MGFDPIRATEFIRELARVHHRAARRDAWVAIWVAISRLRSSPPTGASGGRSVTEAVSMNVSHGT